MSLTNLKPEEPFSEMSGRFSTDDDEMEDLRERKMELD